MRLMAQRKDGSASLVILLLAVVVGYAFYYFYFKESPTEDVRMDDQTRSVAAEHNIDTSSTMSVMESTISQAQVLQQQQQERIDKMLQPMPEYR